MVDLLFEFGCDFSPLAPNPNKKEKRNEKKRERKDKSIDLKVLVGIKAYTVQPDEPKAMFETQKARKSGLF